MFYLAILCLLFTLLSLQVCNKNKFIPELGLLLFGRLLSGLTSYRMAMRVSGMISPFDESSDLGEWMEKMELVASLQGVTYCSREVLPFVFDRWHFCDLQ